MPIPRHHLSALLLSLLLAAWLGARMLNADVLWLDEVATYEHVGFAPLPPRDWPNALTYPYSGQQTQRLSAAAWLRGTKPRQHP